MGRNRKLARGLKKNRIRERYNQKVDELEIHEVTPKEAVRKAPGTIRKVAAYCRVSTQEEQQTSSFELQVKTYTDLINTHRTISSSISMQMKESPARTLNTGWASNR